MVSRSRSKLRNVRSHRNQTTKTYLWDPESSCSSGPEPPWAAKFVVSTSGLRPYRTRASGSGGNAFAGAGSGSGGGGGASSSSGVKDKLWFGIWTIGDCAMGVRLRPLLNYVRALGILQFVTGSCGLKSLHKPFNVIHSRTRSCKATS